MFLVNSCIALCLPISMGLFGLGSKKSPTDRLIIAAQRGDLVDAKASLDEGAEVNGGKPGRGDYGYKNATPLAISCTNKDLEMMSLLIKRGADVNARSGSLAGVVPIENALAPTAEEQNPFAKPEQVARGNQRRLDAVKLLLANGARADATSRVGSTPLSIAASQGTTQIVELLISKGAKVNGDGPLNQPLAEAARRVRKESAKICEILIEHKAKVQSVVPPNMETPLHLAAGHGNIEAARVLISRGAKVDARDKFGATPLHNAAAVNKLELVKLLLEHGASARAEDLQGRKPAERARIPEVKEALAK
jgi:ankyrin repeat protein